MHPSTSGERNRQEGASMIPAVVEAISDMREEEALALAREALELGAPPVEVLDSAREAMTVVGERFEAGSYFVPELILAGEMLRDISDLVKPYMAAATDAAGPKLGTVVLGTVRGDIHDIGKDIVRFMLDVNGFDVVDLGVDVSAERFVDEVRGRRPEVLALSGFLTLSYDSMRDTVAALSAAGIRDDVKVMVGGGAVDEQIRQYAGADGFGIDAMAAVALAKSWSPAKTLTEATR
jgi:5-methyltetrahydrofolate--homocysteine methyltransferase